MSVSERAGAITGAILATLVLGMLFMPASAAGRWDTQVTGGVTAVAGPTVFDLDISSRSASDGTVKGQIQYTRDDLSMHVAVDCVYEAPNGAYAFSGPANVQDGSFFDYVSVEVSPDGTGIRVANRSGETCGYSGIYPGTVIEGSFNIR